MFRPCQRWRVFTRYTLRTTDAEAGRRFYGEALGLTLPEGRSADTCLEAWPLHERARRAGAPAHWLGHLEVEDLDAAVATMVAMGAETLGPSVTAPDGARWATLRDPFEAILALRQREDASPPDRPMAWHQLHTRDADGAYAAYAELTGWHDAGTLEAADPEGGHHLFAWTDGGAPVGSVANTARWPGVHTHWLFHFPVADIDATLSRVRSLGGKAHDPFRFPNGDRATACDDPQGAAFGLIQHAR